MLSVFVGCDDLMLEEGKARPLYSCPEGLVGTRLITHRLLNVQSPIDSVFVESEWVTNTEWVCTFFDDGCPADECTCTPSLMEPMNRAGLSCLA
jgi:hypothetical protein